LGPGELRRGSRRRPLPQATAGLHFFLKKSNISKKNVETFRKLLGKKLEEAKK
jgi:hypothetical protein